MYERSIYKLTIRHIFIFYFFCTTLSLLLLSSHQQLLLSWQRLVYPGEHDGSGLTPCWAATRQLVGIVNAVTENTIPCRLPNCEHTAQRISLECRAKLGAPLGSTKRRAWACCASKTRLQTCVQIGVGYWTCRSNMTMFQSSGHLTKIHNASIQYVVTLEQSDAK